jgi:hypothetical protein
MVGTIVQTKGFALSDDWAYQVVCHRFYADVMKLGGHVVLLFPGQLLLQSLHSNMLIKLHKSCQGQ